jgi:hypothetical protein
MKTLVLSLSVPIAAAVWWQWGEDTAEPNSRAPLKPVAIAQDVLPQTSTAEINTPTHSEKAKKPQPIKVIQARITVIQNQLAHKDYLRRARENSLSEDEAKSLAKLLEELVELQSEEIKLRLVHLEKRIGKRSAL